ncbi:MAG: hypothetical protein ACOYYU_05915 [Chloroflexota bacterium]
MVSKFALKAICIGFLSMLVTTSIFFFIKPDSEHYYQGSLEKVRLLENIPSPRIIIFGGSNIALGIDSEMMEKNFGIPVINDGLQVGLGITPLNEIRNYIRPGDIIIISLEYYNFTEEMLYGQPEYLSDWIEISPNRIWYLHDPVVQIPTIYTIMLQRKINRQVNFYLYNRSLEAVRGVYTSAGFNERGDFVGHLEDDTPFEIPASMYPVNTLPAAYEELEAFHQYALSKGARVFYEAQAHRQTNCDLTGMKALRKFYVTLKNNTTIPLLTDIKQLCLPDDYFYDTPYHLNATGRKVRTERLIENLTNALDTQ